MQILNQQGGERINENFLLAIPQYSLVETKSMLQRKLPNELPLTPYNLKMDFGKHAQAYKEKNSIEQLRQLERAST